jgi:HlyD family secretion protein
VLQRFRESAGPVRAGEVVLEIGDTGRIEAEIEVLSADAVRIAPGTPVRLHRWGGEQPLEGRVQRVEPGGFTKVSALGVEEQRVRVIVDVPSPGPAADAAQPRIALGDGYRVEGEFAVWQGEDVLQVPASALFRDGDAWALYRLEAGRAQLVRVRIGHIGEQAAQVLGGIEAGAPVVLYPGEAISDGARIAAREAATE